MKTGAEILEMLPEEIRGKVDANIGIGFSAGAKELILNDFYRSIYSFLSGAFDWGQTPEGDRFWRKYSLLKENTINFD